jgi:hypothetical protein
MFKTELVDCTATTSATAPVLPAPSISPNPARHWVRVDWPVNQAVLWQAFDLLGRRIASGSAAGGSFTFPVNTWPAGTYILELSSKEGQRAGRVKLLVD